MNQEVAVIDVIERILSQMLPDEWTRIRVVGYFSDKYSAEGGVPGWESTIGTSAVQTSSSASNSWGWGWSGGSGGGGGMGGL